MDLQASLSTPAAPAQVLTYVDALENYPQWMSLVHSATRIADATEPTWSVELRAKVGPFARSKRLRMVRSVYEQGAQQRVVFERKEADDRKHAAWRLEVIITPTAAGSSELVMHLHYDGRLLVAVVEAILRQHIDAGRTRLAELLAVA